MSETNSKYPSERLAEEYKRQQALFSAQPTIVQRFLETQGKQIAQAVVDGDSQVNFSLPDRVICTLENVEQPALVTILQNQRTHSVGSFLNRFRKVELYKEMRHTFTELEQSPDRAVSVAAGLLRHATITHMIHQMLPAGRTVTYRPAEEDETIPSIPEDDGLEPESAITAATDAVAEEGKTEEGRGNLLVPFVPYARKFFLPQWVAFGEHGEMLVKSVDEANAHVKSMQRFMEVLFLSVALAPYISADEEYGKKRHGMLGQLVNQGRALAIYQVKEIITRIKERAEAGSLNRGLRLSLPFFDDQELKIDVSNFEVIPSGRIMFVPAFVVRAVRQEQVKVSQDTRYNPSTRKHLLHLLELIEQAFETAQHPKVFDMLFSIALLIVFVVIAIRFAPREKQEDAHIHGAGQIGLLAALALFGVDYFTSYFYATGEMMSALHPYNLQQYGYIAVIVIAIANAVFGFLYMYSLGVFNEGGGSYTASMRYLSPGLSLIVAVVLLQDYIFTIVVSSLSGVDQLLSIANAYHIEWYIRVALGIGLVTITWYLTIRGRGESSRVVFSMLGVFILMTVVMAIGLFLAKAHGVVPVVYEEQYKNASLWQAAYRMLTASMKGLVALSGLEAMSNGIQFVKNEDFALVKWGKKQMPKLQGLWEYYSGKAGIGRMVQTSFLFYGGTTTAFLAYFSYHFNVFDGTLGRSLVGNLAFIAFDQIPGGTILYWAYQILAVGLLASASMTAFQDLQATEWRDVAMGEIPEIIVYRDKRGTFTRSVTIAFVVVILITFIIRGETSAGIPYYGIGVFMPIMAMGFAVRKHILEHFTGRKRTWGAFAAGFAAVLSGLVFIGQIAGKWQEGGWVVLISFSVLALVANAVLISPVGFREPKQIHRIVREKARVQGAMASIVEWQSLRMQEYRYSVLITIARFFELFGVRRPIREQPAVAGDYDHALHVDHPEAPSLLEQYLDHPEPKVGGAPKETAPGKEE